LTTPSEAISRGRVGRAAVYRWLRRLHVAIFAAAAVPLVVTSLTGALLVFGHELSALLRPIPAVAPAGEPLAPSKLLARVAEQRADVTVWAVTRPAAPDAPSRLWLSGGAGYLEIDPYSGDILDHVLPNSSPYDVVRALHRRWLANDKPMAPITRTIISTASLMLMVQVVIGLWLWALPGKRLQRLKPAGGGNRRRYWQSLHLLAGVATSVLLLLVAFTGISMYWTDSTRAIVETLVGSKVEKLEKPALNGIAPVADLDAAIAFGRELIPGARLVSFRPGQAVHIGLATPDTRVHSLAWIGDEPLRVLAFFDGREASLATWLWQFKYWLHIGDFAGWPVRVLWIVVGLAPTFFVVSGLWLYRDRRH
jgi:uncharacterized iron-regulated membrane protein